MGIRTEPCILCGCAHWIEISIPVLPPVNCGLQGSAADLIKLAMLRLHHCLDSFHTSATHGSSMGTLAATGLPASETGGGSVPDEKPVEMAGVVVDSRYEELRGHCKLLLQVGVLERRVSLP